MIADHMPFAGAAQKLAAAFGARYNNGFAINESERGKPMLFRRSEQLLADHPITNGRDASERIDFVATFTGSAFETDETFRPILTFGESVVSLTPEVAWRFTDDTTRIPVAGWCQGAAKRHGKGRAAVFGEAAMFTAQRARGRSIGMNSPDAEQNAQFVLNVLHWLSGVLD